MANIAMRTTFFVMASIATYLFEELAERLEKMAIEVRITNYSKDFLMKLEEWQSHRVLVYKYMDEIYRCFAFILLIIILSGFIDGIAFFAEFSLTSFCSPRDGIQVLHAAIQFLAVLFVTSRVNSAVRLALSAIYNFKKEK